MNTGELGCSESLLLQRYPELERVEVIAMSERLQAVVAGSRAFVDALGAHLRLRLGAPPLQALTPVEAMKACTGERRLLVLEYGGPDWLEAVKKLRTARDRAALPIVAAVPSSRMAELGALQRAGVEAVRLESRVDPVLWAVDRLVSSRPRDARPKASIPDAPEEAAPEFPEFQDVFEIADLDAEPPAMPPPIPATLPSEEEVVKLLRAALAHEASPNEAWKLFTDRVAAQLGDLERLALSGAPFPLDAAPLRAAASLRWRIAAVVERARATGSPPDPDLSGALPVEVDATLTALKALAGAAGPEFQPGVQAVRDVLVREAIEFTEVIAAALVPAEEPPPAAAPERSAARVITNERAVEATARRGPVALRVALAVAFAIAAGYHVNRFLRRPGPSRADFADAPANTIGAERGGSTVFRAAPGKAIDPAELERLKAAARAQGKVVRQIGRGAYVIVPEAAMRGGGEHP